jgi:cytochrome c
MVRALLVEAVPGRKPRPWRRPPRACLKDRARQATQAPAAAAPALEPIAPLLASANVQNGETLARRLCASCHSFNEGGRNAVGPNLYGVIGAAHGHVEGFNYSPAIKGKPGPWTYEDMNAWLAKPATYAPGTRMAFAGITNTQQRADVIAYLRSISPNAPAP